MGLLSALDEAKKAARELARTAHDARCRGLTEIARAIASEETAILEANRKDLSRASDLSPALRDRLELNPNRVKGMIRALEEVRALPDPLASRRSLGRGPRGIEVYRQ